jgi:hypothetical protein
MLGIFLPISYEKVVLVVAIVGQSASTLSHYKANQYFYSKNDEKSTYRPANLADQLAIAHQGRPQILD